MRYVTFHTQLCVFLFWEWKGICGNLTINMKNHRLIANTDRIEDFLEHDSSLSGFVI